VKRAGLEAAVLLGLSVLLGAGTGAWHPHRPSFVRQVAPADAVTAATARLWGEHVVWVDVRGAGEYQRGHIPGAVRLNEREWEKLLPAVKKIEVGDRAIVVYGEEGASGEPERMAGRLRGIFPKSAVFTLAGGRSAWREAGR